MPNFPKMPQQAGTRGAPQAGAEESGELTSNDAPTQPASPSAVPDRFGGRPTSFGRTQKPRRRPAAPSGDNVAGGPNFAPGAASPARGAADTPTNDSQPAPSETRPHETQPSERRPSTPPPDLAARARANKEAEIARLEKKKSDSEEAKQLLQQFQVLQAGARIEKRSRKGSPQWVRIIVVKNGTNFPIGHVYFKGTVLAAGQDTPVLTDTFDHRVKGGLAPGEQAEWKITARGNAWKSLNENAQMTYNVEVTRLNGTDGKPLVKDEFKEDDQLRLDRLKKELDEMK
jgi:hypothetical protein